VVSRTGDVGTTISYAEASNSFANAPSVKALVHEDSRTVAMEVGSAKECVTTHLPNGLVLKMDCGSSVFYSRGITIGCLT